MAFFLIKITIHSSLHAEVKAEEKSIIKYLIYYQRESSQIYVFALVVVWNLLFTFMRPRYDRLLTLSAVSPRLDSTQTQLLKKKKSISRAKKKDPENPLAKL